MNLQYSNKYLPYIIATLVALVGLTYYIYSGQGSVDQNTRKLQQSPAVDQVKIDQTPAGQKTANVKCKDGSSYDVYIPPGTTNYDALSASKCDNTDQSTSTPPVKINQIKTPHK